MKLANSITLGALMLSLFGNALITPDAVAKKTKSAKEETSAVDKKTEAKPADAINLSDATKPVELKELVNVEALNRWMTYYYLHPQPELLVAALLLADKQGLLQGDAAPPMQAFASRVMAQNPGKIRDWYQQLAPIGNSSKTLVLTAVWWSGTKESKELLDAIAANLPEKAKAEFHKQIDTPAQEIDKMEIESPDLLDMLWACFCATGDEKYVRRLASTLTWSKANSKDLGKMMIASSARWSIISNIKQHPKVKEICEKLSKDPEFKPYMDAVLAAASGKPAPETATEPNDKEPKKEKEAAASPSKEKSTDKESSSLEKVSEKSDDKKNAQASGSANKRSEQAASTEAPGKESASTKAAGTESANTEAASSTESTSTQKSAEKTAGDDAPKPAAVNNSDSKSAEGSPAPTAEVPAEPSKTKDNQVAGSDSQSK